MTENEEKIRNNWGTQCFEYSSHGLQQDGFPQSWLVEITPVNLCKLLSNLTWYGEKNFRCQQQHLKLILGLFYKKIIKSGYLDTWGRSLKGPTTREEKSWVSRVCNWPTTEFSRNLWPTIQKSFDCAWPALHILPVARDLTRWFEQWRVLFLLPDITRQWNPWCNSHCNFRFCSKER